MPKPISERTSYAIYFNQDHKDDVLDVEMIHSAEGWDFNYQDITRLLWSQYQARLAVGPYASLKKTDRAATRSLLSNSSTR